MATEAACEDDEWELSDGHDDVFESDEDDLFASDDQDE